jgi:hypothetical protein
VSRSFDSHGFGFSLPVPSLCSIDGFWFPELLRPIGMDGYVEQRQHRSTWITHPSISSNTLSPSARGRGGVWFVSANLILDGYSGT